MKCKNAATSKVKQLASYDQTNGSKAARLRKSRGRKDTEEMEEVRAEEKIDYLYQDSDANENIDEIGAPLFQYENPPSVDRGLIVSTLNQLHSIPWQFLDPFACETSPRSFFI